MTSERKLAVAAVVIACATGALAFLGGLGTWQYYVTVDECQSDTAGLLGKRIRVNGTVADGTLVLEEGGSGASFQLAGSASGPGLDVRCRGPLPDNLAEGGSVVVEGSLESPGQLRGDRVLTRCASKYSSDETRTARSSTRDDDGHGRVR